VRSPELIIAYGERYHPKKRSVVAQDGRVVASFTEEALAEVFDIPLAPTLTVVTKTHNQNMYDQGPKVYRRLINERWMMKKRLARSKLL